MTLGHFIISQAIEAAKLEPNDVAAASKLLVAKCRRLGMQPPKNPASFIKTWQGRVDKKGNILSHAHMSGRKPKVSECQVEAAYKAIIGWETAGRERPYASATEIATQCAPVKQLLETTGVRINTLIKRIQAVHPRFGREQLRKRWLLPDEIQAERLDVALQLVAMEESELQKVVHLDAKTVYMVEKSIYGYVDLAVGYTISGIRPAKKGGKLIKLKYYAAVNAKLGAFFIKFYTGSAGITATRQGKNYKVG